MTQIEKLPPPRRPGSAFGLDRRRSLAEADLGDIRYRVQTAIRELSELETNVAHWKVSAGLHVEVRRDSSDPRQLEHVLHSERTIPYQRWSTLAGQALHELRSVLDNLNTLLFEKFAESEFDPNRVYFPITDNGKDWRSWRQRHRALPDWAIKRYQNVQPSSGPYTGLTGLSTIDNDRKHKRLTPVHVAIVGELTSGTLTFEGIVSEEELTVSIEPLSNVLTPGVRSVALARICYEHEILDIEQEQQTPAGLDFDLNFEFGGGAYSLPEIIELPRRVNAVVDYIGLDDPTGLAYYMSRPAYAAKETSPNDFYHGSV